MPLYLSENVTEQDYDALYVINHRAFSEGDLLLGLFPGGLDPSTRGENVQRFASMRGFGTPSVQAAKVVDDETQEIVAFAVLRVYDGPPFASLEESDVRYPQVSDDLRPFLEWFVNSKNDRRREMAELQVPGPYGYLSALATDPARQREGAASLLLRWVVASVDAMDARSALTASPFAVQYGLYEKHGFRSIDAHTYGDEQNFPNAKPVTLVTMVRDSRSK